jgi:small subunit ribosomal protein S14
MAKSSAKQKHLKKIKLVKKYETKRSSLKAVILDDSLYSEERFMARLRLSELPRNSSATRLNNRCEITGRPKAYYRKVRMSRIALRELALKGQIPGMTKSSW